MTETPLSVLDLAPISEGVGATAALRNTLDLARLADELGYRRYWLAEHHNMPGIASTATSVLVGQVAAATERIRVGSGGVMLPNHAPLVVAEQFGTLEALHPGRVDLGIGRAPGTDPRTAAALRGHSAITAEDFPAQLRELLSYFAPEPGRAVNAVTAEGNQPPVWLLGSSGFSAQLAGVLGLPFSFAHHFSPKNTGPALAAYRESFRPSAVLDEPYVLLGAAVVCADSDEAAQRAAVPGLLAHLSLRKGQPIALPDPARVGLDQLSAGDREYIEQRLATNIIGGPERVGERLDALLAETAADELMVTTMAYEHSERRRSYELLAKLAR